jgi:hypothetical protein
MGLKIRTSICALFITLVFLVSGLMLMPAYAGGVITTVIVVLCGLVGSSSTREDVTIFLDESREEIQSSKQARIFFRDMPEIRKKRKVNHSHPTAAADRERALGYMHVYAQSLGKRVFSHQMSRTDQDHTCRGTRSYFKAKDVAVNAQDDRLQNDDLLCLVDADYYINMPEFLAETACHTMLYTIVPDCAASTEENQSYTFDANNNFVMTVSGGAEYKHKLWDYSGDCLVAKSYWWILPIRAVVYLVDRAEAGSSHQIINLVPIGRWGALSAWATCWLESKTFQQFAPVVGDFIRFAVHRADGLYISTARVNEFNCATIPVEVDNAIGCVARVMSTPLQIATSESYLKDRNSRNCAAILTEFHRLKRPVAPVPYVFPVELGVRRYQYAPENYNQQAKPCIQAFMSPFVHEAYGPDKCESNDTHMIEARVEAFADEEFVPLDQFELHCIDEFLELLIGERKHTLCPYDANEVAMRMDRPTQRRITEQGCSVPAESMLLKVRSFMKCEAYAKPADPRPISTLNGADKVRYARYIYPFSDVILHDVDWYAFGKNPLAIANRVAHVARSADKLALTDFKRMDGRVKPPVRHLERAVLTRCFKPEYHEEALALHSRQYNLNAVSSFGVRYRTGSSRASGSIETSSFNTLLNAYIAFRTLRESMDSNSAWRNLGVYGGDDGMTPDCDVTTYEKVAMRYGQRLSAVVYNRGDIGVKFLARMYGPGVWSGRADSMCDFKRQISKVHTTGSLPKSVSAVDKLIEKMRCIYLTDSRTPVLGDLATAVLSKVARRDHFMKFGAWPTTMLIEQDCSKQLIRSERTWWGKFDFHDQFPNDVKDFAYDIINMQMPDFCFDTFRNWLSQCNTLESFLTPPLCVPVTPPPPGVCAVVVEGTVVDKEKVQTPSAAVAPVNNSRRERNKRSRSTDQQLGSTGSQNETYVEGQLVHSGNNHLSAPVSKALTLQHGQPKKWQKKEEDRTKGKGPYGHQA